MFNPYATYTAAQAQTELDRLLPIYTALAEGGSKVEIADPHGGRVVYSRANLAALQASIIRLQQAVGICPTGRRIGIDVV